MALSASPDHQGACACALCAAANGAGPERAERFWASPYADRDGDGIFTAAVTFSDAFTSAEQATIWSALGAWESVANLEFVEGAAENRIDFDIGIIDGPGSVLAYATSRDLVVFDSWDFEPAGRFSLETVAIHEIGHVIGLDHVTIAQSTMYPYYSGMAARPTAYDIASTTALYGPRLDRPDREGDDVLGGVGDDYLTGTPGNDLRSGSAGNDTLYGNQGADTIRGGEGGDELHGGRGGDDVSGEAGADVLYGNLGADLLLGGGGSDTLHGGKGDDTLDGGPGDDVLQGEIGRDTFRLTGGVDTIVGFDGEGGDRVEGTLAGWTVEGEGFRFTLDGGHTGVLLGASAISADWFTGGGMPDPGRPDEPATPITFTGVGFVDDHVLGGAGGDWLNGRFGNDTLDGGDGDDTLIGSYDDDRLTGGGGADLFGGFNSATDTDTIMDFAVGEDRIDLGFWSRYYTLEADGGDTVIRIGRLVVTDASIRLVDVGAADWAAVHAAIGDYGTPVYATDGDPPGVRPHEPEEPGLAVTLVGADQSAREALYGLC